jgi:ATP-dependent DNA helicase RecG
MISKEELQYLLNTTETYRVEKTISTGNTDKFCEAICAFSNDMPNSRKNGYLIIGANDDGSLSGLKVDDALMKKISAIRSDGNILPLPVMNTERFSFEGGDLLVAEVTPSLSTPVRYRGRTFIRIGPRKDIASAEEERILTERSTANLATFDVMPCREASLDDLYLDKIKAEYLPQAIDQDILVNDHRSIKEQLASLRLYNKDLDCPTFAAVILFGRTPKYYLLGCYIQYVHFDGYDKASDIINEKTFIGGLIDLLPKLDVFLDYSIVMQRPVPISILKEKMQYNYPKLALRELLMNACMHRDYQSNMPIRLYRFKDRIELMNAGGLYGEARPENFPNVNDYRNPVIAEGMKNMKYVNMFNRGIDRVQSMLKENGNQQALFDVNKLTVFEVTVKGTKEEDSQLYLHAGDKAGSKAGSKLNLIQEKILDFCDEPKSLKEIADFLNYTDKYKLKKKYINLLLGDLLRMTVPDKPTSNMQKYVKIKTEE